MFLSILFLQYAWSGAFCFLYIMHFVYCVIEYYPLVSSSSCLDERWLLCDALTCCSVVYCSQRLFFWCKTRGCRLRTGRRLLLLLTDVVWLWWGEVSGSDSVQCVKCVLCDVTVNDAVHACVWKRATERDSLHPGRWVSDDFRMKFRVRCFTSQPSEGAFYERWNVLKTLTQVQSWQTSVPCVLHVTLFLYLK